MVPFQRAIYTVGGVPVHVMETGRGRPVLMLHGNPTWGFLYRKVAQILALRGFRCIMPDLVGLGLSFKPRDARWHTLDNHAHVLGALVEGLDLQDMLLMVQDWGGPFGTLMASHQPHRTTGLVVMNTVLGPPRQGFNPALFHRVAQLPLVSDVLFRGLGMPQGALWMAQGDKLSIRGRVSRAYRFPLSGLGQNVAPLALARLVPDALTHPSIPALQRCQQWCEGFRGPRAIVWGARDPVLGRALKRVQQTLPGAALSLTQGGHFLQEEVPEVIADAASYVAAAPRAA
jgi:pimeloyl-ACP methyl ester carboxylesterase